MTTANFETLAGDLCALLGEPPPELASEGVRGFSVTVDEVQVDIYHDPERNPECAFVATSFGRLPQESRLAAVHALMEANHRMMKWGTHVFGQDPASGRIFLQFPFPFSGSATALDLYQGMQQMSRHVHQWRQGSLAPQATDQHDTQQQAGAPRGKRA